MRLAQSLFTVIFTLLIATTHVNSQESTAPANITDVQSDKSGEEPTSNKLANWRGILLSIEQALARTGIKDDDLIRNSSDASDIRLEALKLETSLTPLLSQIQAQLDELGAAPADGEPAESAEIKQNRDQLKEKYSILDGDIKAAGLIVVRATQIENQIINNRRNRFVTQISRHTTSLLNLQLWSAFWDGLEGTGGRFKLFIVESISALQNEFQQTRLHGSLILGIVALLILILVLFRRILRRRIDRIVAKNRNTKIDSDTDHYIDIRIAGLSFLRNGVVPALGIIAFYKLFKNVVTIPTRLEGFLSEITLIASLTIVALSLVKVFLNTENADRRLVNMTDGTAKKVSNIFWVSLLIIGAIRLMNKIATILVNPVEVSIGLRGILASICFLALFLILKILTSSTNNMPDRISIRRNFIRWGYLNPLFWVAGVVGVVSLIAGYIAFAEFLAWQILIATTVFALLWLIIELLDIHRERYLDVDSGRWRHLSQATGFTRQTVLQGGVFGFGLAKLAAIITALVVFMVSWGYRTGDWAGPVSEAFFGFNVGGLTISLSSIALAVLLFVAGYIVTRAIQHWMRSQFLPTTSLDTGLTNSIATVMGYAGIVLSALLAITAAGLDLSKVAIVAGALSVGIGFGLQSIVNNFVSGLILLAERPIKSGDWIVTSGGEGTVRKTSVRSTEIETFDGATIIIPNSTLITDSVTNWTHHTQKGRIKVLIGVGYDSDPVQVRDILLNCAQSHERIVTSPAPNVFFQDFGTDALMFELRAYLADINNSTSTKSDLRFAILAKLRQANIEIPFPQRDIHIKSSSTETGVVSNGIKKPTRKRTTKK